MQRIAITSEAGVILKPSCLGTPFAVPPKPMVISLKALSFISITRFQRMVRGSIFKLATLFWILLSIRAANKLFAFSTALKSPVKCKLISSIGTTWEYPPPAAPPLIPKTGPNEGSLNTTVACFPILFNPSVRPIEIVVLPSPAGVGVKAVTKIKLLLAALSSSIRCNGNFALYFPYISISSSFTPNFFAIVITCANFLACAISMSDRWLIVSYIFLLVVTYCS